MTTSSSETLAYPTSGSQPISEVLGLSYTYTSRAAMYYRVSGRAQIPSTFDAEHAFVLSQLLPLALRHGTEWRHHADTLIEEVKAEAIQKSDVVAQVRELEAASQAEVADMQPPTG